MSRRLWVEGAPTSYSGGAPERRWKETLAASLASEAVPLRPTGLRLDFHLAPPVPGRRGGDLDNLLDPVLSVLCNRLGWFDGRHTHISWIHAEKHYEARTGCMIEASNHPAPASVAAAMGSPVLSGHYGHPLPRSARDPDFAAWVRATARLPRAPPGAAAALLAFSDAGTNLGDVATGKPKALLDGLWPV